MLERAIDTWTKKLPPLTEERQRFETDSRPQVRGRFARRDEEWHPETLDAFPADYAANDFDWAHLNLYGGSRDESFNYWDRRHFTSVSVHLPSDDDTRSVLYVFDTQADTCKLPDEVAKTSIRENVTIFVGHGRDTQWRDLKDHLSDLHHFRVTAYETGARAGYTIIEILKQLSDESSFALLVHTGEDTDVAGTRHSRSNVVHETGLFQGKLGLERAIVLLEDGCDEFSNIPGLQQIRFARGNIKSTFGDVLATIYREFGD